MDYKEEVFNRQYPVVVFFVQHLAYHRALKDVWDAITHHYEFWAATGTAHLKIAVEEWCKVFGSYGEPTHWKHTLLGDIEKQASEDLRQRIYIKTGKDESHWNCYQRKMVAFRNKVVAHYDLHAPFKGDTPSFQPALLAAYAYHEWAEVLVRPRDLNQPPLNIRYEQCMAEAYSMVKAAFPNV